MCKVIKNGKIVKKGLNRRQAVMYVSALVQGKEFTSLNANGETIISVKDGDKFKILNEEEEREGKNGNNTANR